MNDPKKLQNCPDCSNEYLTIRVDIYKDERECIYCDVCGLITPRSVWNRITPKAQPEIEWEYCWLVELFQRGENAPSLGRYHTGFTDLQMQSQSTMNPHEAKRYTKKDEAVGTCDTLNANLKTGEWRAIYHAFEKPRQPVRLKGMSLIDCAPEGSIIREALKKMANEGVVLVDTKARTDTKRLDWFEGRYERAEGQYRDTQSITGWLTRYLFWGPRMDSPAKTIRQVIDEQMDREQT